MKKLLLLILFSGLFSKVNAELAVTLNVETPGTLSTMIASSRVPEVTHLTLSGSINDQDVPSYYHCMIPLQALFSKQCHPSTLLSFRIW